jgi:hypothetical protein
MNLSPYIARPIQFLELWEIESWRMKVYSIASGRRVARPELIAAAWRTARERLALSGNGNHHGVGFVGIHDGKTANFIFIDWWADENELHHHVYVSPSNAPEALEYQTPSGLAACVWDLSLMAFEREAWVETVLKAGKPDIENYLNRRMNADI